MSLTLITYLIYLGLSIGLTLYVGHLLYKHGRPLINGVFAEKPELAGSLNRLLLVGFYLLNIGYISLSMQGGMAIGSPEHMVEVLSYKIGINIIALAAIHFLNLFLLLRFRKKGEKIPTGRPALG
ncbi:MAG: hypothetical protein AAFR61_04560 [Bacteroidota bacterium]